MIEIIGIKKKIKTKNILNTLNVELNTPSVIGLIGPNGSGKSTFLKIFVGLVNPTEGSIKYKGLNIMENREKINTKIGYMIEHPIYYPDLTGWENLKVISRYYGDFNEKRLEEIIKLVDIEDILHKKVKSYSSGMKQKLGIAMAIVHNPEIVVFDEPQNNLDATAILNFRNIIKYLKSQKKTIIITSHILQEISSFCDNILLLKDGSLIEEFTSEHFNSSKHTLEDLYHLRLKEQ